MTYTIDLHGYAAKDHLIANAIAFCDKLGGDAYDYARKYMDMTGIIPEWLAEKMRRSAAVTGKSDAGTFHKYSVTHNGKEYETAARSEDQAVNFIRFKLYGTRPLESLPPFSARQVIETAWTPPKTADGRTKSARLTRADIAARLRRMAT